MDFRQKNISSLNSFKNPLETLIKSNLSSYFRLMKLIINIFFLAILTFSNFVYSDEIIKDQNGNYFLMKDDGTFIKLPKPKPGNKYVIKKKKQ